MKIHRSAVLAFVATASAFVPSSLLLQKPNAFGLAQNDGGSRQQKLWMSAATEEAKETFE